MKNERENLLSKKSRDVILNRAKYYYENDKERLRDNTRDKYRNLSEEERNIYHNMSEERNENQKNAKKNYRETKKSKKTAFFVHLIMHAMFFSHKLLNPY